MKINAILILFLSFLILGKSAGLAAYAWSGICAACINGCVLLALAPPAHATCIAGCCTVGPIVSGFLTCFSNDTFIET